MKIEREKILEFINDNQNGHTNFQIDNFIVGKSGISYYGKYKQAIREMQCRYETLKGLYLDRELKQIDIDEANIPKENKQTIFDVKRDKIKLIKLNSELENMNKNILDSEREFVRFYQHCTYLKDKLGVLDQVKKNELEKQYWEEHLLEIAVTDIISTGRLQDNTLNTLTILPKESKLKVLDMISQEKIEGTVSSFYNRMDTCFIDNSKLIVIDIKNDDIKKLFE